MLRLAFVDANLRWNPFGEPTPDERRALALLRVAPPGPSGKLQLIGDAGVGKTTSLHAIARSLPGAVYVWAPPPGEGRMPTLPGGDAPLLVDEAQRFRPFRALATQLKSARTVVIATHEDVQARARVALPTVRLDALPRALVEEVIDARLQWARRAEGPVPRPPADVIDALMRAHAPSLRAIEHALYDWYQAMWG